MEQEGENGCSYKKISYSLYFQISKDWQRMVLRTDNEKLEQFKYSQPRKCLKCSEKFTDSADMFIHIRNSHIKK